MKARNLSFSGQGQFNTLAQSGTGFSSGKRKNRPITVKGRGSEILGTTQLQNRAKKKMITQAITLALIDVATKRGNTEMARAYWNTYHCQSQIVRAEGKLFGNYCKNRFCTLCAGNRKAEIINKYSPVIEKWEAPYFVTLTARSVPACKLKSRMDRMLKSLKKILARNKKRHQRGTGIKLELIRALECNFNPIKRTYNPHFHLLVSSKAGAELIIREWLEQCTPKFALPDAQNMRPVNDTIHDLIEVVKYGSKIFTDPTMNKGRTKATPFVYVSAFHNIICAMKGNRVFDRSGFNLPKIISKRTIKQLTQYEELFYDPKLFDWVGCDEFELLTKYSANPNLLSVLQNNLDYALN